MALSEELTPGTPLRAQCGEQELVLFRDAQGVARALHDACAHRRAPLSAGTVTADGLIECPYHGWRYQGATGQCLIIPNLSESEKVPKAYRVPRFAIDERDGFIRLWSAGDETPDAAPLLRALPDLAVPFHGTALVARRYDDCVEQLLDAPDTILAIPRVGIVDVHRFGDPLRHGSRIVVEYAAVNAWQRGKVAISEYPLRLTVDFVDATGEALLTLADSIGRPISVATLGLVGVGRSLCRIVWRGSTSDTGTARPRIFGIRSRFDAAAICQSVDYVSRLRNA